MSRDVRAQLLEPPSYAELNGRITSFGSADLSPEVGDLVTELFWKPSFSTLELFMKSIQIVLHKEELKSFKKV
jgi:hypothetical protein